MAVTSNAESRGALRRASPELVGCRAHRQDAPDFTLGFNASAARAALASAALAGLAALSCDFALLGRIHRCKTTLRTTAFRCLHFRNSLVDGWLANAVPEKRFTMLIK